MSEHHKYIILEQKIKCFQPGKPLNFGFKARFVIIHRIETGKITHATKM